MKEVNPQETSRAYAFEMWMNAPMPMVTFFKTLDVSRLVKISRKSGMKFNMLMCWCIGKAARDVKEFYMLPVGGKLMQYDTIAVNTLSPTERARQVRVMFLSVMIYLCLTNTICDLPNKWLKVASITT